jgi:hypothetical protein
MAKYGNGCHDLLNFKPLPEGPTKRRDGTIYVGKAKDNAKRVWLQEFIYSATDSYVLEFGDGYIRFFTDNGRLLYDNVPGAWDILTNYEKGQVIESGGVYYYCKLANVGNVPPNATYWHALEGVWPNSIYEVPSPYSLADLTDSLGMLSLDFEQSGDSVFITHPSYPPQKLTRRDAFDWIINPIDITDGPFEDVNPDQTVTVYASAATGTGITLTASSSIFDSAMVGTLFLLEQKKADGYAVWEVAKVIALNAERRSDSNVYQALNAATTGTVKPTHRIGARFDGDTGVQWEYLHSGYGIVRITAVAGTTATADVLSRIPSQAVGAGNASTRWAKASWRSDVGYPSLVKIFRERLCFARGQEVWGSVAGDFESFASRDGAETLPDSAFSITIGSSESNAAVWMVADDALLIGTRRQIFAVKEVTTAEVFGPGNIKAEEEEKYSARKVQPVKIGGSTLFAQFSGRKVRDVRYNGLSEDGYQATDLMVLSGHVLKGQVVQMKYAQEPSSIVWMCCADGSIVGLTYMLEQDVIGWHPHQIGGNGVVESIAVIPSPDGTYDQLWMSVRRTIDGGTKRYIERMSADWDGELQPLHEAIYCDSAGIFDGTISDPFGVSVTISASSWTQWDTGTVTVAGTGLSGWPYIGVGDHIVLTDANGLEARVRVGTITGVTTADVTFVTQIPASMQAIAVTDVKWAETTITGLDYLEGETVDILAEGSPQAQQVVTSGAITLDEPAWYVVVGLPAPARGETMRIEGGSANGISQGKIKRIVNVVARLNESLGGALGPAGSEEAIIYRDNQTGMDISPGPYTGDVTADYPQGFTTDARIRWYCDQPLPFTLCGLFPRLTNEDRL